MEAWRSGRKNAAAPSHKSLRASEPPVLLSPNRCAPRPFFTFLLFILPDGHVLPEHLVDTALIAASLRPEKLQDVLVEANGNALLLRGGLHEGRGLEPVFVQEIRVRITLHGLPEFLVRLFLKRVPVGFTLKRFSFIWLLHLGPGVEIAHTVCRIVRRRALRPQNSGAVAQE